MAYEKRDEAFRDWLNVSNVELPTDAEARAYFVDGIRQAFNAGWAMRKN